MPDDSQQFLNDLDEKIWAAADKLHSFLIATHYKHAVLWLAFLKYGSDYFLDPTVQSQVEEVLA